MKRFAITSLLYFVTVIIFAQEKHTDLPVTNNTSQTYSAHKEFVTDSSCINSNIISNITPIYNKVKRLEYVAFIKEVDSIEFGF